METFLPALAMIGLLWKIVDFVKACANWSKGGKNGAVTQLTVWVAGIVAVFLFAQTDWAGSIPVGDMSLGDMNLWSQFVVGLTMGSLTSVAFDGKKALDPSDSARTPTLLDSDGNPPDGA